MSISVLILTLNEAVNIRACIESLPWRGDVHVLDSASTDDTREIASACGAIVCVRAFDSYAAQRNFGFALPFISEWVVALDADERMTPALATEIEAKIKASQPDDVMLQMRRKDMFLGRWLRRASGYPTWFARVFRRGRVTVVRDVNEDYVADGRVRRIDEHLMHYPFAKGMEWWFDRHNRYSTVEARILREQRHGNGVQLRTLMARDPQRRRAALKTLAYRLPGRPLVMFVYLYVWRGGFLDGRAGFHYASMRMAYEIMIDAKVAAAEQDLKPTS